MNRTIRALASLAVLLLPMAGRAQTSADLSALVSAVERAPTEQRARLTQDLMQACQAAEAALLAQGAGAAPSKDEWRVLAAGWTAAGESGAGISVDDRVDLFERARQAARRASQSEAQARAGLLAAHALLEVGRAQRAHEIIARTLEDAPRARKTLPFMLRARAEAERQLGRLGDALATVGEAERARPEGAAWRALDWRLAGLRGSLWLEIGLKDRAAVCFARERELIDAATGVEADDLLAAKLHGISLGLLRGDSRGVFVEAARLADEDPLIAARPRWRASVRGAAARAAAQLARTDPSIAGDARERLRAAADDPDVHPRERAALLLRMAEIDLRGGLHAAAEALLDAAETALADCPPNAPERGDVAALRARRAISAGAERAVCEALRSDLRVHLAREAEEWAHLPLRGGGHAWLEPDRRRALLVELLRLEERLDGPEAVLAAWLEIEHPNALVRALDAPRTDLRALREAFLVAGQGSLVWCIGPESGVLIAFDSERVLSAPLEPGIRLAAACRRWLARLGTGDGPDVAREVRDLLLPGPVLARLEGWTGATLLGLDALGEVPLALLTGASGERLGESHALDVLPALSLGPHLARAAAADVARDRDLLFVAATRPSPRATGRVGMLEAFEFGPRDRTRVLAVHGPDRSTLLEGPGATRSALLALRWQTFDAMCFLGHGALDPARERPAVLVFSADPSAADASHDLLGCEEVESAAAPPAVFLLCCRGASGPSRRGEGLPANLAGAWLRAGARTVVHSHADLPVDTGVALAHALLEGAANRLPAAEALRRARVHLLEQGHAPQVLGRVEVVGLGHRPPLGPPTAIAPPQPAAGSGKHASHWLPAAAVGVLVLLCIVLVRRRAVRR